MNSIEAQLSVCIIGPDGSGKSSLAAELEKQFSIVDLSRTNPGVYQWLRNAGIGPSDQPFESFQQTFNRYRIYRRLNESDLEARRWITGFYSGVGIASPVIYSRGVLDTTLYSPTAQ